MNITRLATTFSVNIASGGTLTGAFHMTPFTMGLIRMPAAWTAASVGFYVSNSEAGTFLPLYDQYGSLVQISSPAVDKAYVFPADLAGAHWVKLWSQNGSGTGTTQTRTGGTTIGVELKA